MEYQYADRNEAAAVLSQALTQDLGLELGQGTGQSVGLDLGPQATTGTGTGTGTDDADQTSATSIAAPIVLGLARGGVPIASFMAEALGLDWDILVVRKLGVPGQAELAFGAVAAHGRYHARFLVPAVLDALGPRLPLRIRRAVEAEETAELERRRERFLGGRAASLRGRTVILADDGIATGATMFAALAVVRRAGADRVAVAAPVGAPDTCAALAAEADAVVCPHQPADFVAVGGAYEDFPQVSEDEVIGLLKRGEPDRPRHR